MPQKRIPEERLFELINRIEPLPFRCSERKEIIIEFADLYGVSINTVYRRLRERKKPKSLRRSDYGNPRSIEKKDLKKYCEVIAAIKVKSSNRKGHRLSTAEIIRILEIYGVDTPYGYLKPPKGMIKKSTINKYLKKWGYTTELCSIEPAVARFQARHSNECWQFDLSPSDLKKLPKWPVWIDSKTRKPQLMLYSIVDDRSGVAYQEYHAVYGEDVEAALRFLYRAMALKDVEGFPLQGIPQTIYMDNGPISKSGIFIRVMNFLGIEILKHPPKGKDGRRTTSRAKGKVERPFRTVKEVHETLYHFHIPENIDEANQWLLNYILRYNERAHRTESHSRLDDWIKNIPNTGIKKMCSWDRFCTFTREPDNRKINPDATVTVNGIKYEVSHELAGSEVVVWWGLFDNELYVECGEKKLGPYKPVESVIPFNKYRSRSKTALEKKADRIEKLANEIKIPLSVLTDDSRVPESLLKKLPTETVIKKFEDPDPFQEFAFTNTIEAKKAISDYLGLPLAKLTPEQLNFIDEILVETLNKKEVMSQIRDRFRSSSKRRQGAKRRDETL